jgi:diguanylate cyclase (GGDEF)-like protein/PAS domain S-box-containing protein
LKPSKIKNRFHREQALLDAISSNAVLINQQGTILVANTAWNEYASQNEGDDSKCGIANNYLEACLNGDDDAKAVLQGITKILAGEASKFEHLYPCHNPSEKRWYIATVTPYPHQNHDIRVLISHNNVTGLIERQRAIEARENRYIKVIDSLIEGMVIQSANGEIETCNQAAAVLLGLSIESIYAQKSLLPTQKLWYIDGSEMPADQFPPLLALASGQQVRDIILGIGADNQPVNWLKINSHPIFDDAENTLPSGIVTTFVSMSKELHQTQQLRELSERFELAVASASIGIWDWRISDNRLIWDDNMYKLYGINPDDFDGVYDEWRQVIHPEDLVEIEQHLQDTLAMGTPFEKDFRVIWPDKSVHILKPFAIVRRDSAGNPERVVGANQDVTQLRLAQQTLKESEQRLQLMIHHLPVGAIYLDGSQLFMNASTETVTGYPQSEITTIEAWFTILFGEQREEIYLQYQQDRTLGFPQTRTYEYRHKKGHLHWLEFNAFLFEDGEAWIITDISERKNAESKLEHLAFFDPVTQLPNRTNFDKVLKETILGAERHQLKFALLLLDVDQFKRINDTYGHPTGDKLLTLFGERLTNRLRESDMVARLGGDEFTILVGDFKNPTELAELARQLINELRQPYRIDSEFEVTVTVSIGISLYPSHAQDAMRLLRNADTAMYLAKAKGRDTYRFYSEELTDAVEHRVSLESQLREAVKAKHFVLHYQPLIDMASGAIYGVEALIRWHKPDGEIISPDFFMAVAEESGLIAPMGEWVLHQACEDMASWVHAGLPIKKIAVNLSTIQIEKSDVASIVLDTLAATHLSAEHLDLEITETTLISQMDKVEAIITQLKQHGIGFSIDDFGTGYSSLTYLKRFSANRIKIDRSFVSNIPLDKNDVQLVSAIINMGHSMNLSVIAEGVETQEQLDILRELGCDSYQGFLKCRPVSAAAIEHILQSELKDITVRN